LHSFLAVNNANVFPYSAVYIKLVVKAIDAELNNESGAQVELSPMVASM